MSQCRASFSANRAARSEITSSAYSKARRDTALVLSDRTAQDFERQIEAIAQMIKPEDKAKGALIAGTLLMGLFFLATREA